MLNTRKNSSVSTYLAPSTITQTGIEDSTCIVSACQRPLSVHTFQNTQDQIKHRTFDVSSSDIVQKFQRAFADLSLTQSCTDSLQTNCIIAARSPGCAGFYTHIAGPERKMPLPGRGTNGNSVQYGANRQATPCANVHSPMGHTRTCDSVRLG